MSVEIDERKLDLLARAFDGLMPFFSDESCAEVMLNDDGSVFVEIHGQGIRKLPDLFPENRARMVIEAVAGIAGEEARPGTIIETELPPERFRGARFEGLMPPITTRPTFSIRMPSTFVLTLDDYEKSGAITHEQREILEREYVQNRANVLIAGGTSSGKTTFANALLDALSKSGTSERIVIIEDTRELRCNVENTLQMRTITGKVDQLRLLSAAMRLRPDRVLVGEVRDGAALALLKAWNTGHPGGLATVHANSAEAALMRIESLVGEATQTPQPQLVGEAIDLIVSLQRLPTGERKVHEIIQVEGFNHTKGEYEMKRLA